MNFPENKYSLLFDVFFSVVIGPAMILLGPAHHWISSWPLFSILVFVFLYGTYFTLRKINIPHLLLGKKYRRIATVLVATILINALLTIYPHPDMDFGTPLLSQYQTSIRDYSISLSLWLMYLIVIAYYLTIAFVTELYDQMIQRRQIEAQRDKAKLAVFKAQISPHFLFNTLNSLYSLVIGTSDKAEDAFIKFTELLKYAYVTIENEFVDITDEINYINNYIDLQKLRLNDHTKINFRYDIDRLDLQIPPMLMLTFVENAFKYGASPSRDCSIDISIKLKDGLFEFATANNIMKHPEEFRNEMPVGVENCRARLSGLYPGRHSLNTTETNGIFNVNLTIQITDNDSN